MDIRQMRYFLKVAEELHFRRAAELLHLSQPSLTQQIHQMEAELGAQLFVRSKRKIELTQAGKALVKKARAILDQVNDAVQEVRDVDRASVGILRIGAVSPALFELLPPLVKQFSARFPSARLQINASELDPYPDCVIRGDLDLGFTAIPFADDRLASMVVRDEGTLVALPAELDPGGPVDLREFAKYTAILSPRYYQHRCHVRLTYELAGVRPAKVLYTNLILTAVHLVAAGFGIAIVPESLASSGISGVVFRPLAVEPPATQVSAVWRPNDDSMLLRGFVQLLAESVQPKTYSLGEESSFTEGSRRSRSAAAAGNSSPEQISKPVPRAP